MSRSLGLSATSLLLLAALGCGRAPSGFDLVRSAGRADFADPGRRSAAGFVLGGRPERLEVTLADERRQVVALPAGTWSWRGTVPEAARLVAGVQASPEAWKKATALEVTIDLSAASGRRRLFFVRVDAAVAPNWQDVVCELDDWAGQQVELIFGARLLGASGGSSDLAAPVLWGPVVMGAMAPQSATPGPRPNIVFILVDTLRFDHTSPYGYARDTTPGLQRLLAARGVVMEDARSQAPWTIPSVASFMTAVEPGEFLRDSIETFGIAPGLPTLAERLHELGYETGGFYANPTLHEGNGFGRGFTTFATPPATLDSMLLHAEEVNRKALPWLQSAMLREPFFLYAHYIDPHDPYENPDMPGDRSPYDEPDYAGPATGRWVHGIYSGKLELSDRERELHHLTALYDGEVHYADRFVGELVEALPPAVAARTLFVFTSDHGEELLDHGGWKHGQTLYEEQIHVPLVWRWDGHIAPGRRLQGAVRLLDVAPTLLAAAGDRQPFGEGVNLLPALVDGRPVPRLLSHSRHLAGGPLRAAVIAHDRKLVLFNRQLPFVATDALQDYLWRQDLRRLQRVELYDLVADPREQHNLAASDPAAVARLQPLLDQQLDRELAGLRVIASGLPPGCRCRARIELAAPPPGWLPYFLGEQDRVELRGTTADLELEGESLAKGLLVTGEEPAVEHVEARLEGTCPGALRIVVGEGHPLPAGEIAPSLLAARSWPEPAGGPTLRIWLRRPEKAGSAVRDPETERRLRALGYIQ